MQAKAVEAKLARLQQALEAQLATALRTAFDAHAIHPRLPGDPLVRNMASYVAKNVLR